MIAIAKEKTNASRAWHAAFLLLLPAIQRQASIAFRDLDPEAREEAIQETICNAMVAYWRLAQLGKEGMAYASVLARYGVAQVRSGRKVGGKLNVKDISSEYCQQSKGVRVERLDHYDADDGAWREILVEDKRATPADIAATRIDVAAWLRSLSSRNRKVAVTLARGENTSEVAKQFEISPGRISQLRRELAQSWQDFQGDTGAEDRNSEPDVEACNRSLAVYGEAVA